MDCWDRQLDQVHNNETWIKHPKRRLRPLGVRTIGIFLVYRPLIRSLSAHRGTCFLGTWVGWKLYDPLDESRFRQPFALLLIGPGLVLAF
jgi:hypothetical protein